jgi:hypothetical protein
LPRRLSAAGRTRAAGGLSRRNVARSRTLAADALVIGMQWSRRVLEGALSTG